MRTFLFCGLSIFVLGSTLLGPLQAQVVTGDLLVTHRSPSSKLDRYAGASGVYVGPFAATGSGFGPFAFEYGSNGNLYSLNQTGSVVGAFHGQTGFPLTNLITAPSGTYIGAFAISPTGILHAAIVDRMTAATRINQYDSVTGNLLGTWVPSETSGLQGGFLRFVFGPDDDLFVTNGNKIMRYRGSDGTPLGSFIMPGNGGLQTALDILFAPGDRLLVSGITGGSNDRILQFDSNSGAFLGNFASGNGLSTPFGMAIGPNNRLYVASTIGDHIDRFNLDDGSFVDTFVALTTTTAPAYIAFMPVPEPSSLALIATVTSTATIWIRCRRKLRI